MEVFSSYSYGRGSLRQKAKQEKRVFERQVQNNVYRMYQFVSYLFIVTLIFQYFE